MNLCSEVQTSVHSGPHDVWPLATSQRERAVWQKDWSEIGVLPEIFLNRSLTGSQVDAQGSWGGGGHREGLIITWLPRQLGGGG